MATRKHPNKYVGETLDSLLEETGELWEVQLRVQKRILAEALNERMKSAHVTKSQLAKRIGTSRSQVDACLDAAHVGMTLSTMARALDALGLTFTFNIQKRAKASRIKRAA